MKIAEDTVKIYLKQFLGKLEFLVRAQAVVTAAQRGFIEFDPHENPRGLQDSQGVTRTGYSRFTQSRNSQQKIPALRSRA